MKVTKIGNNYQVTMSDKQLKAMKKALEEYTKNSPCRNGFGDDIDHLNDSFVSALFRMKEVKVKNEKATQD